VASGGPDGVGDAYLELTSLGGIGPGSRLAVNNALQWTGDYLAEGITDVVLDANLFSANPVSAHGPVRSGSRGGKAGCVLLRSA
jgi:hypothetical protein